MQEFDCWAIVNKNDELIEFAPDKGRATDTAEGCDYRWNHLSPHRIIRGTFTPDAPRVAEGRK